MFLGDLRHIFFLFVQVLVLSSILSLLTLKNTFFFEIGGSSHMRRSELRGEGCVFWGHLDVFCARKNEEKKMQKQHFKKKVENRKNKSQVGKISSTRENRVHQKKKLKNCVWSQACFEWRTFSSRTTRLFCHSTTPQCDFSFLGGTVRLHTAPSYASCFTTPDPSASIACQTCCAALVPHASSFQCSNHLHTEAGQALTSTCNQSSEASGL